MEKCAKCGKNPHDRFLNCPKCNPIIQLRVNVKDVNEGIPDFTAQWVQNLME